MKYVRTFESFKNNKNEPVNEEFLGKIGKWLGNMFKKAKENIRKTDGGQEIEVIYQKYLKKITDELQKQAGVVLNLTAAVKESKINEAEETVEEPVEGDEEVVHDPGDENSKMTADTLKKKSEVMKKVVLAMKNMALKEMDAVLKNKGGAKENPQLQTIIDVKKSQFDLDFMNAEIAFLEKSGDKTMVAEITKQRDVVAKQIAVDWRKFEESWTSAEDNKVEYKVGDTVAYKRKDFTDDKWKALTDDDKKSEEVLKQSGIVDVKSIISIDGDNVEFKDKDDNVIKKKIGDILLKFKSEEDTEETPKIDFSSWEEGDKLTYKQKDDKEGKNPITVTYRGLSDDDKYIKVKSDTKKFIVQKVNVIGKVGEKTEETK
jgi:hypothetical protein